MKEQINTTLMCCCRNIGHSSHLDEVRFAGVIEGVLTAVGDITLDEIYQYRDIEVENPDHFVLFLIDIGEKEITRKETWVEYMKRRAKEYLNKEYNSVLFK